LDQSDFYTMTVRGITRYRDGTAVDFASETAARQVLAWHYRCNIT
jgi:hypothetical protein